MGIIKRVIGKKIFHLIFINMSYRNRGYVPRIHRRVDVIIIRIIFGINIFIDEKNRIVDIILRISILAYSAKKIKANHPPMYSTLNPDTSSDSPSAKSKGLRFTSAKHVINHIINRIVLPQKKYNIFWDIEICVRE